jgi:hypothetical protein
LGLPKRVAALPALLPSLRVRISSAPGFILAPKAGHAKHFVSGLHRESSYFPS